MSWFPKPYAYGAATVLVVCVGAAVLTGSRPTQKEVSHQSRPTIQAVQRFSLTGLPSDARRGVVVVKVNNTPAGGPQVGINKADVVVEQLVEGGLTRLAVMYQSRLPARVGPVRSGRSTDKGLVMPTHGWLVDSGASWFEQRDLNRHGVRTSHAHEFRVSGRVAPYNLMLAPHLPHHSGKLRPYFNFTDRPHGQSKPASKAVLHFGAVATTFTRAGRTWRRSPDLTQDPFRPTSVLVLRVRQRWIIDPTTGRPYHDAAMTPVPEQDLTGRGPATLLWHGRAYRGTWRHPRLGAPWHVSTGVPIGRTAVELVPRSQSATLR
ncbi:MAG: DUF3048 domain-containing protein [Frankiaceae bacterium]